MMGNEFPGMLYHRAELETYGLGRGFPKTARLDRFTIHREGKHAYRVSPLDTDAARTKVLPYETVSSGPFGGWWILVNGCWDGSEPNLPHNGHRKLLYALSLRAPVVVGVESDETVRINKADLFRHRPISGSETRALALARLPYVRAAFVYPDTVVYGAPDPGSRAAYAERFEKLHPPAIALEYGEAESDDNPFGQYRLAYGHGIFRIWHQRGNRGLSTTSLSD